MIEPQNGDQKIKGIPQQTKPIVMSQGNPGKGLVLNLRDEQDDEYERY